MTIKQIRNKLRRGGSGRFFRVSPGDLCQAADIVLDKDDSFASIRNEYIGQPCGVREVVIRLVFISPKS